MMAIYHDVYILCKCDGHLTDFDSLPCLNHKGYPRPVESLSSLHHSGQVHIQTPWSEIVGTLRFTSKKWRKISIKLRMSWWAGGLWRVSRNLDFRITSKKWKIPIKLGMPWWAGGLWRDSRKTLDECLGKKNINQPQPLNNKLESVIDIPENKPNVTGFPRNPSHFVVVWWPLWCDAFSEVSRRTPEFEVWRVFWKTLDDLGWPAGISIKRWRVLARRDFAKPYLFTNQSNYEFGIVNKDPTKEHGLMLVHHSLGEGILEFWQ